MSNEAEIQRLMTEVAKQRYAGARLSCLAFSKGNTLVNLVCRLVFAHERPAKWETRLPVGPFALYRSWLDGSAVAELSDSGISLGSAQLVFRRADGSAYHWSFRSYSPLARRTIGWPSHELMGNGDDASTIAGPEPLTTLEQRVLGWSGGRFGSILQLRRFIGAPDKVVSLESRDATRIEVFAPTYSRIRAAALKPSDGELVVDVECCPPDVRPSFMLYVVHDMLAAPLGFAVTDFKRAAKARWRLSTHLQPLEGPYDLHLLVGDFSVDTRRVGVPRLSSQVHALIDVDGAWMRGLLGDTKNYRGSDGFEHYVVTLLQLCGIPAVRYGFKSPENAPDLVAELDEETILVAECKVVPPTTEMLETLHGRALSLAQSLWGPRLLTSHAVFFHATAQSRVPLAARQYAYEHGVHLVGRERLELLHALWERGEPTETLIAQLLGSR